MKRPRCLVSRHGLRPVPPSPVGSFPSPSRPPAPSPGLGGLRSDVGRAIRPRDRGTCAQGVARGTTYAPPRTLLRAVLMLCLIDCGVAMRRASLCNVRDARAGRRRCRAACREVPETEAVNVLRWPGGCAASGLCRRAAMRCGRQSPPCPVERARQGPARYFASGQTRNTSRTLHHAELHVASLRIIGQ